MARDVARVGLTLIGGYVGGMFGYPQLGMFLGGLVGNAVFPQKLPGVQGPRLSDLTIQTSTVGTAVPEVYGTFLVAGNIIWSSGLIETVNKEEVGGKGGGPSQKVTTYSYRVSCAIGLCKGPMAGYLRIFADSKVIYDGQPQGYTEALEIFNLRIAASALNRLKITFYPGDEDQLPDPTIESYEGVGNVQAFRGLCYIVLTDFELEDYGNRIPNFRVEVYEQGEEGCETITEYSNEVLLPWIDGDSPINQYNRHEYTVAEVGSGYAGAGRNLGPFDSMGEAIAAASAVSGKGYDFYSGYRTLRGDDAGVVNRIGSKTVADYDVVSVWMHFSSYDYDQQVNRYTNPYGTSLSDYLRQSTGFLLGVRRWSNGMFSQSDWGPGAAVYMSIPAGQTTVPEGYDFIISGPHESGGGTYYAAALDALIKVERIPRPPDNQCNATFGGSLPAFGEDFCILPNGTLEVAVPWTLVDANAKVLQRFSTVSVTGPRSVVATYPLSPALPFADAGNTQAFWEAAYNLAVARGEMAAGLVYGVDYPDTVNHYYARSYEQCTAAGDPVTLASIVRRVCASCGLDPYADIDVADLEAILVHGFAVARTMSGRDMLEPLRAYGFFDAVESGGILKFVTRGKAAVATLEADDLGAYASGEERPPAVITDRKLEFEMPRSMRVHYARPHADYEPGQQDSSRQATSSAHLADVEIPVAMTDALAQQIAEVLHYDAWAGRNSYETSLDLAQLLLEPTDCVLVPVDGQLERMRIEGVDHHLPSLMRFDLVRDDDGSYTSYAVGIPGEAPGSDMGFIGPSGVVLLDIPALRDEDNDAGYYAAVRPLINSSAWHGAVIFRSADGGASFTQIGAGVQAAAMGQVVTALPSGPHEIFDEGNSLVVELYTGELEGRTEDAILNGANAAAIGVHGRWEIVQFRDASLSGGLWTLTGLLRGRRGTEWAIGESVAGDTFVLLSGGGIARLPLENAAIGAARTIKVVTMGEAFNADDTVEEFTGAGVALKPFSPVFVTALRQDDGDIFIAWIRRGRLSQELRDGADIPLSEATEAYEVDIVVADAVVRTLEAVVQNAVYSLADQATDFGSPLPVALTLRVYQLSAIVGRGYPAEVEVPVEDFELISGPTTFDSDAVIFTGEARETDVNGVLSWARQGDAPRLSGGGFVGDGYEARYLGTSLPGWLASSGNPVTVRATIDPYFGSKHGTRDSCVHLGNNDATANPKVELCILDSTNLAGELDTAVRSFTGSMQTQRMCRRNWRFRFGVPEKESGGNDFLPQGLILYEDDGTVLVSGHFEATASRAYLCTREGVELGRFDYPGAYDVVIGTALRDSDGTSWAADFGTGDVIRFDVDAAISSGTATAGLTFTVFADNLLGAIAWVEVAGDEYLLAAEYRTSGTPYLYVIDPAQVINGDTFNTANRVTRLELPFQIKGVAYRDGLLYLARTGTVADGLTYVVDFDSFLADLSNDGDAYTVWLEDTIPSASEEGNCLAFDAAGELWQSTSALTSSGGQQEFFAVWSSPLTYSVANTYQVRYVAGAVEIKINDRPFVTKVWTSTITPACLSIGGPPAAAAGQANGFCSARVRNVVVQSSDLELSEPVIYDSIAADSWAVGILNPGAEDGTADWTVEAGTLGVFTDTDIVAGWVDPKFGDQAFYGGNVAATIVSQTFMFEDITEVPGIDLEGSGLVGWVLVEWWASGFAAQSDRADVGIRFLQDGSPEEISETFAPALVISPQDTFVYRSWSIEVPAGAVGIEVVVSMVRVDGTENNGHWEEIAATLLRAPL